MKKIRILLVGGGSGGHIYPLIAVAQKIQSFIGASAKFKADLRYFGDAGDYENLLSANGIRCFYIVSSKLRRYFSLRNFLDVFKFFMAFFHSLWRVFWFMPDVVFSKGGPGSLPILFACKLFAIPLVIHESDSVPGLTNLISGKIAKKIFLSFDSARKYFVNKDNQVVGNPIRSELLLNQDGFVANLSDEDVLASKKQFGLENKKPVLLVLGGSQGAVVINNFVLKNIEFLTKTFSVLHQTGEDNFEEYKADFDILSKALPDEVRNDYKYFPYFDENLKNAYIAADLVLARAGAGTIFELAYFGKPSVLIPLPDSAGDHQAINASEFAATGAALDIQQENFLSHLVLVQLESIINNSDKLKSMSRAATAFYRQFSSENIAAYLLSFGGLNIYPDSAPIKEAVLK